MKLLVVFSALAAAACASFAPLAQPAHHAALLLDPHGRSLDTAEVINARAIHLQAKALEPHGISYVASAGAQIVHAAVAPIVAVAAAPAAVSHQSRLDVRSSPAIVATAPVLAAHGAYAAPLLGHSAPGLAGHGHLLKKRSLGHLAYAAPVLAHAAPVAPVAVAPVAVAPLAHSVVAAPALVAAPAAVSLQSRVDVSSSPAIVATAPVLAAHGAYGAPLLGHSALGLAGHGLAGHGHLLKKRSLGHLAYAAPVLAHAAPVYAAAPVAVSHQSREDLISSPAIVSHAVAAPVVAHAALAPVVSHAVAPAAVSHQSRVDVRSSPAIVSHPVLTAPLLSAPVLNAHSSLALSGHGHVLKKRSLGHVFAPVSVAHAPAAVSHQSRVDVISRPAIVAQTVSVPVAVAHNTAAVLAHAAPIVPLSHSAIWSAPASHVHHGASFVQAAHL